MCSVIELEEIVACRDPQEQQKVTLCTGAHSLVPLTEEPEYWQRWTDGAA